MYSVEDAFLVLSMVGKAKAPEHKFKTSSLEYDEHKNCYKDEEDIDKTIYLYETIENVKANLPKCFNCVYMYSRNIHNINDVFEQFVSIFKNVPNSSNYYKMQ
jgi:hypothetical protein